MLQDKEHDEINNDRTSKGEKAQVYKIHPHGGGPDPKFFSQPGANPKGAVFKPLDNSFNHLTKIRRLSLNRRPKFVNAKRSANDRLFHIANIF